MLPFKWSKANEIFMTEFDAEHRNLYRMGSELRAALGSGADRERLCALLQTLAAAAEEHFRNEERQMRGMAYPAAAWHKHQHDAARKRTKQCAARAAGGDTAAIDEFLKFLSGWLNDHTAVADRMMSAYLRNQQRRERALAS